MGSNLTRRRVAKRLHPDVVVGGGGGGVENLDADTDTFVRAVAAYEILSCERRRAMYDTERRANGWMRGAAAGFAAGGAGPGGGASSSSSSSSRQTPGDGRGGGGDPWASIFEHSEILREYRGAVDALVPRRRLREEIYAALADVIEGPALDVEEVRAGVRFPKYFEAEERATGTVMESFAGFGGLGGFGFGGGRMSLIEYRRRLFAIDFTAAQALGYGYTRGWFMYGRTLVVSDESGE